MITDKKDMQKNFAQKIGNPSFDPWAPEEAMQGSGSLNEGASGFRVSASLQEMADNTEFMECQ